MKLFLAFIVVLFTSCTVTDCVNGEGKQVEDTRKTTDFTKIELDCSADVFIKQVANEPAAITVVAPENLLNHITTVVTDDKLVIDTKGCINYDKSIEVHLTLQDLDKLIIDGSGDVKSESTITTSELELVIDGSGNMTMDVVTDDLRTTIDGSGDVILYGNTKKHKVLIDGSGNVEAFKLESDVTKVTVDGSGDVEVTVYEKLKAIVEGSGDIDYKKGDATVEVDIENDGSGDVKEVK